MSMSRQLLSVLFLMTISGLFAFYLKMSVLACPIQWLYHSPLAQCGLCSYHLSFVLILNSLQIFQCRYYYHYHHHQYHHHCYQSNHDYQQKLCCDRFAFMIKT